MDALVRLGAAGGSAAEAFLERQETVEVFPHGTPNRVRRLREQGLSVRRTVNGKSTMASADTISGPAFASCCNRVAGASPCIDAAPPPIRTAGWPPLRIAELERVEARLKRAVLHRRVAFPLQITARRHRRQVQVLRAPIPAAPQFEEYFSLRAVTPWGAWGGLLPSLDDEHLGPVADCLVDRMRARGLPTHRQPAGVMVLGPAAAAVLFHETIAHLLEADTLALSGAPDHAVGLKLGASELDVLDDPGAAPALSARSSDDEGTAVVARWLLRRGRVRQPLADLAWSDRCAGLVPGAGRRMNRHRLPGPRCFHVELLPGRTRDADLFAEASGGLLVQEFEGGALNPLDGSCLLRAPCGQRLGPDGPAEHTGPVVIRARALDLVAAIAAVGDRPRAGGAGWCAKDGALLPVWARSPSIRLEGVETGG